MNNYPNWVSYTCGGNSAGGEVSIGEFIPDDQIPGKDNREKIWNYLISLGFTPVQAAGAVGNIGREGVYDPLSVEDGYGLVARSKNPDDAGNYGWGLIGFTPGHSVFDFWAKNAGLRSKVNYSNVYYISTQLSIVYNYMKNVTGDGGGNMWKEYEAAATSPSKAAVAWESQVENAAVVANDERSRLAEDAMRDFGSKTATDIPANGSLTAGGGACCPTGGLSGAGTALSGDSAGEQVYNFFVGKGLSDEAAAAATGNLEIESASFTVIDGYGGGGGAYYGIAQWSPSRRAGLVSFAGSEKKAAQLETQLEYVWHELTTSYKPTLQSLRGNDSLTEKVHEWGYNYEGALNPDGSVQMEAERQVAAKRWLQKAGGGSFAASPTTGGCGSGGGSGEAFILDDYAWPVDFKKAETSSGYPWPCPGNCHHDGTPAFDLSTKKAIAGDDNDVVGRAEFAITDGTIESLHIYDGISGCYSFHIKSSTDGYDYYYTHARNPAVRDGQQVKVGDKVAEVGERKCTGNGSYPHLHIDRGKPKGAIGGYECCRDSGLVPIINKLYASLPG